MLIREYVASDEKEWVRCRTLAFLDTAYFDDVRREKEKYENPAIELVAVIENQVVGLIDIEYELEENTVCPKGKGLGGMIWNVAVHPDLQRHGIGTQLLYEAERIALEKGLNRLEVWTRDDDWVNKWYEKNKFTKVDSYFHVFIEGSKAVKHVIHSESPEIKPVQIFAHYTGKDLSYIKNRFKRVHECNCYQKNLV
ncbi:GNAT family N-acetyltransferase [Alkalihalobacillus sp. AL-G]|uniref:GNAT family N-acetyltransferase n=1 Tax=Alkalihalobacillus sp. AL-G TaxID=2926399 RepID=UPI00272D69A4|nr:GNAT family N-acetyltransferase [Alkalihalobacillus sp. AL-G]WLD94306.1 GNAT family N-acetyltransferase [Alkalihalobacillus sp. AL-G]